LGPGFQVQAKRTLVFGLRSFIHERLRRRILRTSQAQSSKKFAADTCEEV
jgi:hypothetical protein